MVANQRPTGSRTSTELVARRALAGGRGGPARDLRLHRDDGASEAGLGGRRRPALSAPPVSTWPLPTQGTAVSSTWPKLSPFSQANGQLLLVTFSSKIDYGLALINTGPNGARRAQL